MFKKILYPTDFSECSAKALEYVTRLKNCGAEEVVALYVIDEREVRAMTIISAGWLKSMSAQYEREVQEKMEEAGREKLEGVKTKIENAGLKAITKMAVGIPFTEIVKVAEEEDASLIVLGSHGKSNIEEVLLGSVSENVIKKAKRPTLVVAREGAPNV